MIISIPAHRFHSGNVLNTMWANGAELSCWHPGWQQGFSVIDYDGNEHPAEFIEQKVLPGGTAMRYRWRTTVLITIWI